MSIGKELRIHAPFTLFGALTGVVLIVFPILVANRKKAPAPNPTAK